MQRAYRYSTRFFAVAICALGVAIIVMTIVRGGGAFALGILVGIGFVAMGAVRLYLSGER